MTAWATARGTLPKSDQAVRHSLRAIKLLLSACAVASPTYWFMMQIGMIVGFFTAWPVNTWLVRKGWKEKM